MSFAIVTDSLAGLPLAQIAQRGLVVIPLSYTISGKEHLCLAPEGYDSAAFFQTMKLRGEVSTSMVPPHRFLTFLKPLLRSGLDLLFLSASSGLSSSYQSACMAAEQLREEFPQRKLQIVDSLSSSLGQGLLVLRAFDLRERGMCLEDTARTLLSLRHRIAHLFTVDDLMYLSRGGRLSGAKAMLGTALGLKPLLKGDPNGRIVLCGKARGRAQAIGKLADQYNALVMVDDSHAVGFVGKHGRGTAEYNGVEGRVDIITGTLGKALGGASGGYTSGRREIIDLLRQRSRPYLFSNTLAPAIVGASLELFDMLEESTQLRDHLEETTAYYRKQLTDNGFDIIPGTHPCVPVMLYDEKLAGEFARRMMAKGVYVVAFSFPVVPKGKARIRTQVCASHTREDIDFIVGCFKEVREEMGLK